MYSSQSNEIKVLKLRSLKDRYCHSRNNAIRRLISGTENLEVLDVDEFSINYPEIISEKLHTVSVSCNNFDIRNFCLFLLTHSHSLKHLNLPVDGQTLLFVLQFLENCYFTLTLDISEYCKVLFNLSSM